jgi:mono/diheme cytochrome c family protein
MTCSTGDGSCEKPRRRGALLVLALMAVIFLALSAFSFVSSHKQAIPSQVTYGEYNADQGKRVFQSFDCMGCHTIVGNGAYLGPDLTKEYEQVGPAWLEAFLPSAGSWPTAAALRTHLMTPEQLAAAGVDSFDDYLKKYPGAASRLKFRGGTSTEMPNLTFTQEDVGQLIAFLKYTSVMNNEGWPPRVEVGSLERRLQLANKTGAAANPELPYSGEMESAAMESAAKAGSVTTSGPAPVTARAAAEASDPVATGKNLVESYGCTACHATDASRKVGPGWGGLYNSKVKLSDGRTVLADKDYLAESIRDPDAKIVAGYPKGVMPSFDSMLKADQVDAMVAYLVSLNGSEKQ